MLWLTRAFSVSKRTKALRLTIFEHVADVVPYAADPAPVIDILNIPVRAQNLKRAFNDGHHHPYTSQHESGDFRRCLFHLNPDTPHYVFCGECGSKG